MHRAPRGREAGRPDKGPDLRSRDSSGSSWRRTRRPGCSPTWTAPWSAGSVFVRRVSRLPRLERSRTIPAVDDLPVCAVLCFNVRAGHRRQRVATALLDGLVDYADARGHRVEAYPIDPAGHA